MPHCNPSAGKGAAAILDAPAPARRGVVWQVHQQVDVQRVSPAGLDGFTNPAVQMVEGARQPSVNEDDPCLPWLAILKPQAVAGSGRQYF